MKEFYSQVCCSYLQEGFWCVDAWRTDDQNEEGHVVAVINDKTADIFYIEPEARFSPKAQETINAKVAELNKIGVSAKLLHVATLIEVGHSSGLTFVQTFADSNPTALAEKVRDAIHVESENSSINILWDFDEIFSECKAGNQKNGSGPLVIEIVGEAELGHEFLLSTNILPLHSIEEKTQDQKEEEVRTLFGKLSHESRTDLMAELYENLNDYWKDEFLRKINCN